MDDHGHFRDFRDGRAEGFVRRFSPLIRHVARRVFARRGRPLTPSREEDVLQDALLALTTRVAQYRPDGGCSPAGWVGLIARQCALKATGERESTPLESEPVAPPEDPALAEALKALPAREALCLRLLVVEGLGPSEVAPMLGVSRQTVHALRERALERLRRSLYA